MKLRRDSEASGPVHDADHGGYEVLPAEGPARLAQVFAQVYKAALICFDGAEGVALSVVSRIAVDSLPGRLGCDKETARRELRDLVAIGQADSSKPAQTEVYEASIRVHDAAQDVYPEAKDGPDALRKPCGR